MGRLTGVMDERGKFIYIQLEEMHALAAFIRKRGRISIAELAAHSHQFVDLETKGSELVTAVPTIDFDSL
jgi:DDRGK domain-containing protein 1